jgi:hypothetical protein
MIGLAYLVLRILALVLENGLSFMVSMVNKARNVNANLVPVEHSCSRGEFFKDVSLNWLEEYYKRAQLEEETFIAQGFEYSQKNPAFKEYEKYLTQRVKIIEEVIDLHLSNLIKKSDVKYEDRDGAALVLKSKYKDYDYIQKLHFLQTNQKKLIEYLEEKKLNNAFLRMHGVT